MPNFLYPRTISISRPNSCDRPGIQPYGGLLASDETTIATGISAHIQSERQGKRPETGLPADAAGQGIWKIIFKAALGLVRTDDIITDELGNRYQVITPDWGPMVTTCRAQILQN